MDRVGTDGRSDLKVTEANDLQLSVIIPVYNEGPNIASVLEAIQRDITVQPREVLVVHDFDEDDTVPVVKRLQPEMPDVRLHRNALGRGVLYAIRAGFAASSAPFVVVMMADGSDDASVIDSMVGLARQGADVVAASRYMSGGAQIGGPRLKKTLSRLAGLSLYWLGALPIHDPTSNFKLYSRRLLDQVTVESNAGFELAIELTVKARLLGGVIKEIPTTWRDRTAGSSRFRLWSWLPRYLHWYLLALQASLPGRRTRADAQRGRL